MKRLCVILYALCFLAACQQTAERNTTNASKETKRDTILCPPGSRLDISKIDQLTGMKGSEKGGEYKITIPQNDLHVVVDGFKIIPPMGLSSWVAFSPCGDSAMVMGDLILTETDLKPVQSEVTHQGFSITAIHNHFLRNRPNVMYMHIDKSADVATLSNGVKAIFNKIEEVRKEDPKSGKSDSVVNTLNISMLDSIIGSKGEQNKGVYKYTIPRPDVRLLEHGQPVSSFMGFNTWAAWQGTPEKAAVAGDFTMLENEVEPVIRALVENGIEVVAVHNHMIHEEPKIFFLHYWGVGNARQLAVGLKAALNQTGRSGNSHG